MLGNDESYRDVKLRYNNPENRIEVYSAYDIHRRKEVMIKRIGCSTESDAEFYMVEGQNTISERHPNICECYDVFYEEDTRKRCWRTVIVMEKLHHDLFEEIEDRRTNRDFIPEERLWEMIRNLIGALAYLQRKVKSRQNLAHRDLKPHNIFIDSAGNAKLGDFGSSKEVEVVSGMAQHTMQGTPLYLSPKIREAYVQFFNGPSVRVAHNIYKSDVYSLGVTMVHTMTLLPPNDLAILSGLSGRIDAVMGRITHYSDRVKRIVRRMLVVEEAQRPDFVELDAEVNPSSVAPVPAYKPSSPLRMPHPPAAVVPPAVHEPAPQSIPELEESLCSYCGRTTEVFALCHFICFECFSAVVTQQARERRVHITCRCGAHFSPSMLALVLDPSHIPS